MAAAYYMKHKVDTHSPARGFFHARRKEAALANPIHKTKHGYYVASFASGGDFLFDEIDLPLIRAHTWHLGKRGYPATHIGGRTVVLHRLLFPDVQEYEIDHINGDKLDNRRRNLRLCTHQQNAFNQKRRRTNTSGYIGVSYARGRGASRRTFIIMGASIIWDCSRTPYWRPGRGIVWPGCCSASMPG